jgi:isopentenyl-diphosphate delta-isomerase
MIQDEVLDLVDENYNVIASQPRGEVYKNNIRNFRTINCFIKNDKGELWIPVRSPYKRIFPNAFDMSCGGHVSSGETYEEAFYKEMQEELSLDMKVLQYKVLGKCTPYNDDVSSFQVVYEVKMNEVPNYN